MCIIYLLLVFLSIAAIMDLLFDKIYNEWILVTIVTGLSCAVWQDGGTGLMWAILSMTIPVVILYPLFMIGALGAGDIKLLAAAGCFLTVREIMICLTLAFLAGAVLSLLKMLAERSFLQRMSYLLSYILDVFKSGEWKFYEEDIRERKERNKGKIHFAVPILLGVVLYKGGVSW